MWRRITLALLGMILMSAGPAFGQDNGGGPGGPGGPPGGPPPDFAHMRQRMEERLKERLGRRTINGRRFCAKIEAVQQLQRELHPRPPFAPGGPRGMVDPPAAVGQTATLAVDRAGPEVPVVAPQTIPRIWGPVGPVVPAGPAGRPTIPRFKGPSTI